MKCEIKYFIDFLKFHNTEVYEIFSLRQIKLQSKDSLIDLHLEMLPSSVRVESEGIQKGGF